MGAQGSQPLNLPPLMGQTARLGARLCARPQSRPPDNWDTPRALCTAVATAGTPPSGKAQWRCSWSPAPQPLPRGPWSAAQAPKTWPPGQMRTDPKVALLCVLTLGTWPLPGFTHLSPPAESGAGDEDEPSFPHPAGPAPLQAGAGVHRHPPTCSALSPPPWPHSMPDDSVPVGFPANHRSVCPRVLLYIHPRCTPAVATYAPSPVESSLSRARKARWLHPATNPNGKYFVTK